jgi:hypothetical protein
MKRSRTVREPRIKPLSEGCKYDDVARVPFREVLIIISHPSGRRANILERAITVPDVAYASIAELQESREFPLSISRDSL